jgi:hypothetical protein
MVLILLVFYKCMSLAHLPAGRSNPRLRQAPMTHCARIAHEILTIAKRPFDSWRVQMRHKGRCASEAVLQREDALRWSRLPELSVDRCEPTVSSRIGRLTKSGKWEQRNCVHVTSLGTAPCRSKDATRDMPQRELGGIKTAPSDR